MIPCTARPAPPPEMVEAPPDIEALYRTWHDAPLGHRSGPLYDLVQALYPFRGRWLDVGARTLIWLRKDDTVGVSQVPTPPPQPEEAGK